MRVSEQDWQTFLGHAVKTMQVLEVGETEVAEVVEFVLSLKEDIV